MQFFLIIPGAVAAIFFAMWYRRSRAAKRETYIQEYAFPNGLMAKLENQYPALSDEQRRMVGLGLKQFFLAHGKSGKFVSMPSVVADDLWHEFILYTKAYEQFCRRAFGKFMHHTPAVVLGPRNNNSDGLRRMWWHACKLERINPKDPSRLPLLFALDTQLAIPNGFIYQPNCDQLRRSSNGASVYCGGDFGCSSSDSSSWAGDSNSSSNVSDSKSGDDGGSHSHSHSKSGDGGSSDSKSSDGGGSNSGSSDSGSSDSGGSSCGGGCGGGGGGGD